MFLAWTITAAVFEDSNETKLKSAGYPQVVWVWLFGVFYSLAWSGLLVAYALEILPYKLRAKDLMIMNMTVQAALVLGNYTNPIAWKNHPHHWNFELFYTVSCWIYSATYFMTETLTYSCRSGSSLNSSSSSSSISKPVAQLLKNWQRYSTERTLRSRTLISTKLRRNSAPVIN